MSSLRIETEVVAKRAARLRRHAHTLEEALAHSRGLRGAPAEAARHQGRVRLLAVLEPVVAEVELRESREASREERIHGDHPSEAVVIQAEHREPIELEEKRGRGGGGEGKGGGSDTWGRVGTSGRIWGA